jgi:SAM-dependent methyltransferase
VDYELERINREQSDSEVDPFTERRYRQFARHLGGRFSGQVLDVGCNTGRGGRAFTAAVSDVILDGVELLEDRVKRIPAGIYRKVYNCPLEELPPDAGPYDALLIGEVIEHVPLAGLDDLIEQAGRLLARGGRLVLTTPNPHYSLRGSRGGLLGGAHISTHCPVALKKYLSWKGWQVETVTGSGRSSVLLGERFPLALYSSYLLIAARPSTPESARPRTTGGVSQALGR